MGIFDEAIREHLDLKRRQGVDEGEIKELEDEAFGLPDRPGDEVEEPPAESGADERPEAADAPAPAIEEPPATVEEPAAPASEETPEPEPEPEDAPEALAEPVDEAPPHGDAVLEDPAATPPPPPDEGPVEDAGASFSTAEREAIADKPTEFFDQTPEPIDLGELDLDLDEEGAGDEPDGAVEPAVETLEPEPEPDDTPVPAPEPEDVESVPEEPSAAEPEPEDAEEGEDVLEETPEFLRENPDDDELWFEQGKPKDFDF